MNYIFDIDGTLTPPREPISPYFAKRFVEFCDKVRSRGDRVVLVSGSDFSKTKEQLGNITTAVDVVYNCNGAEKRVEDVLQYQRVWEAPPELHEYLRVLVEKSEWKERYSNHIENRSCMLNFSTIGRDCPHEARKRYAAWDREHQERKRLAVDIQRAFPGLQASIGGEISIDITPWGMDKSAILEDIVGNVMFFGDKTMSGGNDHEIAIQVIQQFGVVYDVTDWEHTRRIIAVLDSTT